MKKYILLFIGVMIVSILFYLFALSPKKMYCGDIIEKQTEVSYGMTHYYVFLYDSTESKIVRVPMKSNLYPLAYKGLFTCQESYDWQVE